MSASYIVSNMVWYISMSYHLYLMRQMLTCIIITPLLTNVDGTIDNKSVRRNRISQNFELFYREGVPKILQNDDGSEFASNIIRRGVIIMQVSICLIKYR